MYFEYLMCDFKKIIMALEIMFDSTGIEEKM